MSDVTTALDRLEVGSYWGKQEQRAKDVAAVRQRLQEQDKQIQRLTEELDEAENALTNMTEWHNEAQARVRALQDGLREMLPSREVGDSSAYGRLAQKARALLASSEDSEPPRQLLVSVNQADTYTTIVGKSAICPDCGNALLLDSEATT